MASGTIANKTRRRANLRVWMLYCVGLLPAIWAFYQGATGKLGADPVKSFEHILGLWALRFLILTILVTPVRDISGISFLKYRRALGLLAFYYAVMHFSVYVVLDQALNFQTIFTDITRRPFITIGMVSLVLLIPLALTSNNWSIRKLGKSWGKLHKLVYVAIAAGAIHFLMSVKSWPAEPVIYATIVGILLLWRIFRRFFPKPLFSRMHGYKSQFKRK